MNGQTPKHTKRDGQKRTDEVTLQVTPGELQEELRGNFEFTVLKTLN